MEPRFPGGLLVNVVVSLSRGSGRLFPADHERKGWIRAGASAG